MSQNKIKLAIIGVGYWGKNLVRVFSKLEALDAICDTNPDNLKQLKKQYPKVNTALSYTDILKNKSIKAVVISTPAETHYRITREALLAGKDVFVEKPLALTLEEGRELVELARRNKRILMVGHLLEYHPAVCKLADLIKKGEFGKIQYIYSNRLNLGRFRKEENILWSFAPHDISVVLLLLNEIPQIVSVYGGSYLHHNISDVTVTNFVFASGVRGHIFVSWLHPYKEQKLVVVGDKKMAVFDDVAQEDKLLVFKHKIDWVNRIPVPRKENAERIEFKMKEPLLLECQHFLQCLKTRKTPKTDGKSALKVLAVLHACQNSLENSGVAVAIDPGEIKNARDEFFYVHPTATIEQPCSIGKGTKIWHYTHVMKGARVGENCNIGQNVFLGSKAELGNSVKVQNNVSIYDCVKIEDDVFCGPSVVFTNVRNPRSFVPRKDEYKETIVKRGASLGANSTLVCGISIGEYAFIGAGAVVTKDIPAYALSYGNPAQIKGWICRCGEKLNFKNTKSRCHACGLEYVFNDGIIRCSRMGDKVGKS